MKVAGIIAEYNPFHNGHKYHIEETRKNTGADYIIAIMSGDFVQRGAPAIMDKYERAFCALSSGCDLVLELPIIYSTASAEFFASGAVTILDRLGVCDYLSFGSESGTLEGLSVIADTLLSEPASYQKSLRNHLKTGISFPAARFLALQEYFGKIEICQFSNDFWTTFHGSNNILALEYLKCLKNIKSKITPITIERKIAPYHDKKLHSEIASATAIREFLHTNNDISPVFDTVPKETSIHLAKNHQSGVLPDFSHLTPYLHCAILNTVHPEDILDWDTELANRLKEISWPTLTFEEIIDTLKSRHLTQTRIQRALLHLILGMDKTSFSKQYTQNPAPYTRILGFRKESSPLLKEIKNNSNIPVITKPASITKLIHPEDSWVWEMDLKAARLYQSIMFQNFGVKLPAPYTRSPMIL